MLQRAARGSKGGKAGRVVAEPQSRKLRVVSSLMPRPLTLCAPDFLPELSNLRHLDWLPSPLPLDRTQMV